MRTVLFTLSACLLIVACNGTEIHLPGRDTSQNTNTPQTASPVDIPTTTTPPPSTTSSSINVPTIPAGGSASQPVVVLPSVIPAPVTLNTPFDNITDFDTNPTTVSVQSGSWSDPLSWSAGVPIAGSRVAIKAAHTISYDVSSTLAVDTVVIRAGGKLQFRTDISTKLVVKNFVVLDGGELEIGTETTPVSSQNKAEVLFADSPLDLIRDPAQYGNGLIVLGKVTMFGARKTPYVRLAAEPKMGDLQLTLSQAPVGWGNDQIVVPDTRQLHRDTEAWGKYVTQAERIRSTSTTGTVTKLYTSTGSPYALKYDHKGARNTNGDLEYLPHVMNLSRNVVVRSENSTGNRGYTLFTMRANVDIQNVQFGGLGRTTESALDDTTFNADKTVAHIGLNQNNRFPITFHHLTGPYPAKAGGYQFVFANNSVFCPVEPMPFRWGISLRDSHYGLIKDNVVYNWAGFGIGTLTGNETLNTFDGNMVVYVRGKESARPNESANYGACFWMRGFNQTLRNNIASTCIGEPQGIVAGGGIDLSATSDHYASVLIPAFPGADMKPTSTETRRVKVQEQTLVQFSNNEVYGAMATGLVMWHHQTSGYTIHTGLAPSVIDHFTSWNAYESAFFGYPTHNLVFDHFTALGDPSKLYRNAVEYTYAFTSGDYWSGELYFINSRIEGYDIGFHRSLNAHGTTLVQNCVFKNYRENIRVEMFSTPGARTAATSSDTYIDNVEFHFGPSSVSPAPTSFNNIYMKYATKEASNFIARDDVYVTKYDRQTGNDFRLYYYEQAANYIIPLTTWYGPDANNDGIGDWIDSLGAPVAGFTNAHWSSQPNNPIAIAGSVAPSSARTVPLIFGLVD